MKNPGSKMCCLASYGTRKQLKDFVGRSGVAVCTEESPGLKVGFVSVPGISKFMLHI